MDHGETWRCSVICWMPCNIWMLSYIILRMGYIFVGLDNYGHGLMWIMTWMVIYDAMVMRCLWSCDMPWWVCNILFIPNCVSRCSANKITLRYVGQTCIHRYSPNPQVPRPMIINSCIPSYLHPGFQSLKS